MLHDCVALLSCPHCGEGLTELGGAALRCPSGHSYDLAKQGYVSLLAPGARTGTADTAAMVAARSDFLGAGHYIPIAELLSAAVPLDARTLVDVGAGTGWYAGRVLDERPQAVGLALDVSKFALRRAARAHPRLGAVVCDAWRPLPVRDGSVDVLLNVFAPRNGPEMRRVLRVGGRLLVVSPTPRHLEQLVGGLGLLGVDDRKEERLAATLEPHLAPAGSEELDFSLELTHAEVRTVVGMGPSAWHTDPEALERRIAALPERVRVTGSVRLSAFERREDA